MHEKVTKIAIASRLILFCIQFIANNVIKDHAADAFRSPKPSDFKESFLESFLNFFFSGFRRWDAEYYLHIAEYGYTYEHTLAFYPLFPGIVNILGRVFHLTIPYVSLRATLLVTGIILNGYFFHRAANCLYDLTQKIFKDPHKSWNTIVLFCFNPASIFFSAPYSEGLFCWLTFSLMLEASSRRMSFIKVSLALALSIVCRSNGLVNLGFPIYFALRSRSLYQMVKVIGIVLISLVPLTVYNFFAFQKFCSEGNLELFSAQPIEITNHARSQNFVLADVVNKTDNSEWCDRPFPFPYSYIQRHYWDVGFLRYYQLKQLPNFLLAMPILLFLLCQSFKYFLGIFKNISSKGFIQTIIEKPTIPFVIHALFLTIFCALFVHIQVSTRLLASATPCLYWFAVDLMPQTFQEVRLKSIGGGILFWFAGYFIVGTVLFSNFFPWT
ncbi:PIGV family protein [Megaselia abdita]